MRKTLGRLGLSASIALLIGCGSSGVDEAGDALLSQEPHCAEGEFRAVGMIDGHAIEDIRTESLNAGYSNFGDSYFETPFSNIGTLQANQVGLRLTWDGLLFGGNIEEAGGTIAAPADHPRAGEVLCVTAARVGFAEGGAEDGAFKFRIWEARSGADCSGASVLVDLRGCFN